MFVLEFDTIKSILLDRGDVGCTILYHAIK